MALQGSEIALLGNELDRRLQGDHIAGLIEFDQGVFYWQTSKKQKLVFILHHDYPRVYLGDSSFDGSSLNSPFSTLLRKMLSRSKILSIHSEEGERILYFDLERTNEVFKKEKVTLVFEMMPIQPRLLLLDQNQNIITSSHYSSLDSKRPLLKGMHYELPDKGNFKPREAHFDYDAYCALCKEKETAILQKRKLAFAGTSLRSLASRRKTIEKKIEAIKVDIQNGEKHLGDSQYGDYIYMNFEDFSRGMKSFEYEGETIALDETKTPAENAENFYKRAKKAKKSIAIAKDNLSAAEGELQSLIVIENAIAASSFDQLPPLLSELGLIKIKGKKASLTISTAPYMVVENDARFLYGKNAKQNDYLSFVLTQEKSYLWFHTQVGAGAHLVIFKPNPSQAEIQRACELVLLASGKESGEVMYCPRENIKRGSFLGQAIVKEFSSAYIRVVSEEAKILFETSKRLALSKDFSR